MQSESKSKTQFVSEDELKSQQDFSNAANSALKLRFKSSPKAFTHTYGCQGNVSDGERINGMLEKMGFEFTDNLNDADLVLYNTCAVREHAEERVFGNVGVLKELKALKPEMIIVLCGCMIQQPHIVKRIEKSFPYVDLVFGTHVIHKLPEMMFDLLSKNNRIFEVPDCDGIIAEGLPQRREGNIKAFLPIAYGCNNFCSYCVVPYVRGRERSRDFDEVIKEAKSLIADGYKEITLLGQNVNSYGNDLGLKNAFSEMLKTINNIDGEFLIRFMTSHPKDCTKELLETMAQCEKVEKHLHLPFQSGNNRVLKEMNRGYTREHYLELVDYARILMPDLSITSDVIVGFPSESYKEFKDTLSLVETVKFTSLYTFIYSKREGTKAAKMEDTIDKSEKSKWFKELTDLQSNIAANKNANLKGKVLRVLAEGKSKNGKIQGRTSGNVMIEFEALDSIIGEFCNVQVTEPLTWILRGRMV